MVGDCDVEVVAKYVGKSFDSGEDGELAFLRDYFPGQEFERLCGVLAFQIRLVDWVFSN